MATIQPHRVIHETTERILIYIIGGIFGFIVAMILINAHVPFIDLNDEPAVFIIFPILGMLCAIAFEGTKMEQELRLKDKIRNETIAIITHETRTGLTATRWTLELIKQNYAHIIKPDDAKMLEDNLVLIDTTVMHSINLLDISMLDIGRLSINLESQTLKTIDEMFIMTVHRYVIGARQKNVQLTIDSKLDHTRSIEADLIRLRIILENLIENALQYTVGDTREIHVTASNDETSFKFSVADTGIGIPALDQEKIFEEFYRANNARQVLSSGSGIGLYLCREYTQGHHGTITFTSEEGKGTTFFVTIPLKTTARVNEFLEKV